MVLHKKKKRVFVGMSGGVDSSVSAYLLKKQGYDVVGVFIRCYNIDGCAERDAEDARRVAEHIGVPFYVFDMEEAYKKRVMEYMVEGYKKGITPNPDVMCNKEIKFGLFFERAMALGADMVATGHYAEIRKPRRGNRELAMFQGKDKNKDQTYFLWTLGKKHIQKTLFPIGGYEKKDVRLIARKAGIPTARKKDSQGICFLGDVSLADFLKTFIKEKKGDVVTENGEMIGTHKGVWFYTIGQRHIDIELKNGIKRGGERRPLYVTRKDVEKNILYVSEGGEHDALFRKEIKLHSVHIPSLYWNTKAKKSINVYARVRYRQPVSEAILSVKKDKGIIIFETPQKYVAEGQSVVFYTKDEEMIGGGVIK
jgi:tRNA-specific 2-thiouridylase